MKKRWFGGQKFDSKWEKELSDGVLKNAVAHPSMRLTYKIDKTYKPDFYMSLYDGDDTLQVLIEAKGRFRDRDEARKYIFIKKEWEMTATKVCGFTVERRFIFLFYNPDTPMPFAKKRKDGTKLTHGEWATKNGFEWYTTDTLPEELKNG